MTNTNENDDLPLGYAPYKGRPNMLMTQGDTFKRPTLPGWGDLPDDLIQAMQDAHNEAAFMYGDEGAGYESHLMLAYLLGSDAFKAWEASKGREVWGVQVGTWPPQQYQNRTIAEFHAEQPNTAIVGGVEYPVYLVKGTAFNTVWEVVE